MWKFIVFALFLTQVYTEKTAVVYVFDPSGATGVTGNIIFTKTADNVLVNGTVTGLNPGNHGFHIHNLGHIAPGCVETGPHFNPHNVTHGGPNNATRHVGDLGNVIASINGVATFLFNDSVIDLEGEHNIIGRAVVVHADPDDLGTGGNPASLETGNAGARVACGVIGILSDSGSTRLVLSQWLILTAAVLASGFRLSF